MQGGNLALEWKVFDFARKLQGSTSDLAAKKSISMGLPQVMGFNCANIGYESVDEMFQAFSESGRPQIIGLFDFVKGPAEDSEMIRNLQDRDFVRFAANCNGTGQAARYGEMIRSPQEGFIALCDTYNTKGFGKSSLTSLT